MAIFKSLTFIALLPLLLSACHEASDNCLAISLKEPICGTHRPEDMAKVPGRNALVVSEMGNPLDHSVPGGLSLLDLTTDQFTALYPLGAGKSSEQLKRDSKEQWGDPNCSTQPPEILAPHGIDLSLRKDQKQQLIVINHGSREAVEFFELIDDTNSLSLVWRGCVVPKPATFMNNIVSLSNGGFIATQSFDYQAFSIGPLNIELIKGLLGWNTGYVFEWHPTTGFKKIPGADGRFVNGVALSKDERTVYASYYMGDTVRKIDRATGKVLAEVSVSDPDNLTWTDEGNLLVASHQGNLIEKLYCLISSGGACVFRFGVYELDANTLASKPVIVHKGQPMGGVTVATQVNQHLYLGSFSGNRVMRIPYRL